MPSLVTGKVGLALLLAPWGLALGSTPEQQAALKKVIAFYRQVGDDTAARQLEAEIAKGTVRFGKTSDNVNAECDMGTRIITLHAGAAEALAASDMRGWQATASLAETLWHEMVHQKQGRWAWTASYWQETVGQGNPCEQQAWGSALQRLGDWIRTTERELEAQKRAHPRVQAETARRLQLLCAELGVVANDYKALRQSIGELPLRDAAGRSVSLEAFLAAFEPVNRKAAGALAIARQVAVSFEGTYKGTLGGAFSGTVGFRIDGFTVTGRLQASAGSTSAGFDPKGTPFDVAGSRGTAATALKQTLSADLTGTVDVDGNLKVTVKGTLTETGGRAPGTRPFTGEMGGTLTKRLTASGSWSFLGKTGTWTAAK